MRQLIFILLILPGCGGSAISPDGGGVGPDGKREDALANHDAVKTDAHPVATISVPVRENLLFYYYGRSESPSTDEERLLPYLAYVDSAGKVLDPYLFDTFTLLDLSFVFEPAPNRSSFEYYLATTFTDPVPPWPPKYIENTVSNSGARLVNNSSALWQHVESTGPGQYTFEVAVRASAVFDGREAAFGIIARDVNGAEVNAPVQGLVRSTALSPAQWYHYLPVARGFTTRRVTFTLPTDTAQADIYLWKLNASQFVDFDRVQLVKGNAPLSYGDILRGGGATLIGSMDFDTAGAWKGYVAGPGLERRIYVRGVKDPLRQGPITVAGGATLTLAAEVRVEKDVSTKEALFGVKVLDGAGNPITSGVTGLTYSSYLGMFFQYIDAGTALEQRSVTFTLPSNAAAVVIALGDWESKPSGGTAQGVEFDKAQLVIGKAPLSQQSLRGSGYRTLLEDGNFEEQNTLWQRQSFQPFTSGRGVLPVLAQVARTIGDPRERNVFLTIPSTTTLKDQANFGAVDGREIDCTTEAGQIAAYSWFVDEAFARWHAAPPPGLALKGFFWLHEQETAASTNVLAAIAAKVHTAGLMLVGSPYRRWPASPVCVDTAYTSETWGFFDRLWQQPNVWPPGRTLVSAEGYNNIHGDVCFCQAMTVDEFVAKGFPVCELSTIEKLIDANVLVGMPASVNIEWASGLESIAGHGRVVDYLNLDGKLPHDFLKYSDHMIYETAGFAWTCARSDDPVLRAEYDAFAEFARRVRVRHGFPTP